MNHEQDDKVWERLQKALFGRRHTTDEGLFTYSVMERIRALQPDLAWPRFLRWAVPALGVGLASLGLTLHRPQPPLIDNALFGQQTADEDPLSPVLEDYR